MPLIIDTDIGSDIDDCIAVAYAVRAGIDLKLITTVHGDTVRRARIAHELVDLLGANIPIAAGQSMPIKQKHIFTIGTEEDYKIHDRDVDMQGVQRMIECIKCNPGIHIAAIGPMTNIATALIQSPDIAQKIGHIYLMGHATLCEKKYHLEFRSHNLKVDPEAADIVFATNIPTTIITTPGCKESCITQEDFAKFTDPALSYIRENSEKWLTHIGYSQAYLYDPLTIHHYLDQDVTKKQTYGNVSITTGLNKNFKNICLKKLLGGDT